MAGSEQGGNVTFPGLRIARFFRLAFLCFYLLPAAAKAQFLVTTNTDGTLTIVGYTGPGGAVTIPDSINGMPVTTIANNAFYFRTILTSVTIGTNVTYIGNFAFCGCTSLTNATIPGSVTFVGDEAFAGSSTARFYFMGNAPTLGVGEFFGDNATVIYTQGTTGWGATFGGLPTALSPFAYSTNNGTITITQYTGSGYTGYGGDVSVPGTINGLPVSSIGDNAFAGCPGLISVTIPSSVTNMGNGVFSASPSLVGVYFRGNAPSAGSTMFTGDTDVTAYYMTGTTGWGTIFGGISTALFPFAYTSNNGTVTITGYAGSSDDVSVPGTINGLLVTGIGDYAFSGSSVASVALPNSVLGIGTGSFAGCVNLISVNIPNGATNIGDFAFDGCTGLINITIPNSVLGIGTGAFAACANLANFTVPNGVSNINDFTFENCSNLTNIAIPNTVTGVGNFGFYGCTKLASITIPDNVTGLGEHAFEGCISLTSATIGNRNTSIGEAAFAGCLSLAGVYFQGNAPGADSSVFAGDNIATVYHMAGTTGWGATFGGIPTALFPFAYATNNGEISITGYDGTSEVVSIPSTIGGVLVTGIGGYAFSGTSVTNIIIPTSVASIGSGAFQGCADLANVTIGGAVTYIADSAFAECVSLTSVTIPDSVGSIGINAFASCTSLSKAKIGVGLIGIGAFDFYGCGRLTSVTIGSNVASIGDFAFNGCSNLSSITIPDLVAQIGNGAISDCTSLIGVYFQGNAPNANLSAFAGDDNATAYYKPGATGWGATFAGIPAATFPFTYTTDDGTITISAYTGATNNVSIPETIDGLPVTVIASSEFGILGYNSTVTNVTIPASVTNIEFGAIEFFNYGIGPPPDTFLASINVDPNNSVYTSIDGVLIDKIHGVLVQYPVGKPGSSYTIPDGVTNIADDAFYLCTNLTDVTFSDSVTSIGNNAFQYDVNLTNVNMGNSLRSIGSYAFSDSGLTSVTIPNSVRVINSEAFDYCTELSNVTIGNGVTTIAQEAFVSCPNLTSIYFLGNAPTLISGFLGSGYNLIVYYLPGATGWGATYGRCPTSPWLPQVQTGDGNFGIRSNQFGFNVTWASNQVVIVQAAADLANPIWQPVATNTLNNGSFYFSDPQWSNYPSRFYRITTP